MDSVQAVENIYCNYVHTYISTLRFRLSMSGIISRIVLAFKKDCLVADLVELVDPL